MSGPLPFKRFRVSVVPHNNQWAVIACPGLKDEPKALLLSVPSQRAANEIAAVMTDALVEDIVLARAAPDMARADEARAFLDALGVKPPALVPNPELSATQLSGPGVSTEPQQAG